MTGSDRPDTEDAHSGSSGTVLTLDLDALVANYRLLAARCAGAACAAVVKADAYGLGMARVAPALAGAGCETFLVAHLDEGVALRDLLPRAAIFVFNGALPGAEPVFAEHRLAPVLNDLGAVAAWAAYCRQAGPRPAALHVDTGMLRLGLPPAELERLAAEPGRLDGVELALVLSHLACAEERDNPMNPAQRAAFEAARERLPRAAASFANSSGIFLGPDYHFDLVRPGAAIYGINPIPDGPNPMANVVSLRARILQVRDVDSPNTVGYGATHRIPGSSKIATIAVGYADGYLRSPGNRGSCFIGDHRVPVVGRVSMDLITLDVTEVPAPLAGPGAEVEVIGDRYPVDAVAADAGTIGYEVCAGLGHRYHRLYVGGDR